ncbi:DNA cytosine methyltransferase [Peribacillus sp. Bi134]|uniref:DNA cytosine methyltransferase n=1 Tax=Peribacillus sp. Bi134 TaxID=2884272 RepID=UPI001DE782CA|nr:DNA cytosine methyltransferase [Peribacillus sp. Bi134]CAH0298843.1 hypothetical protein SRABI134_04574 [Peribacillus sp. Bi134]
MFLNKSFFINNHTLIEADVRDVNANEMPDVDIITASWPCVAFYVAGNKHGMKYKCHDCEHEHSMTHILMEQFVQSAEDIQRLLIRVGLYSSRLFVLYVLKSQEQSF